MKRTLVTRYRSSGADLPGGDPRPSHGAEMEGYFWRFTEPSTGRVVVVLCGVNRHIEGAWATVAVALHPGLVVRSGAIDGAWADASTFSIGAGDVLRGDGGGVTCDLGGVRVEACVDEQFEWPLTLGGGGVFSAVPFLNQYWHPHILGGRAQVTVTVDSGETWTLRDANVYAEKNWGKGFPERWWWGQAQGFPDRPDVCVTFSGGVLAMGPVKATVGGAIARVGDSLLRLTPPFARIRSSSTNGEWRVNARGLAGAIEIIGDGRGAEPHVLPVPLPAERRNIDTDYEHLAGRLWCRITPRRGEHYEGETTLAGLEVGSLDGSARP